MKSLHSSRILLVLLGSVVIALFWLGVAKIEQVYERSVASSAMKTLDVIQLGSTSKSQAEELLLKYSKYRVSGLDDNAIQLGFENRRWLPMIRPSQFIWITLEFKNDITLSRSAQFAEAPRRSAVVNQSLQASPVMSLSGRVKHRDVIFAGSVNSPYSIVKVYEDTAVPIQQRARDWNVDFRCFQLIFGCHNVAEVLTGAQIDQRTWR
jgi:hypothetical protein